MITAKQIAEKAGVSRGTVDRVLHGRGGVNEETEARVRRIAQEWGYTPSRAGRALGTKGPVPIGVIMSSVGNSFFADVQRGMEDAARDFADFPVELLARPLRGYQAEEQAAALDELRALGVRGMLLTPVNAPSIARRIDEMENERIPVVTVNTDVENCRRTLYVGCDDRRMGRTAGKLMGLLTGGKGKALVVAGSLSVLGHLRRWQGFQETLGAEYPAMTAWAVENGDDDERSRQVVLEALNAHPEIDCVYFAAAGAVGGTEACAGRIQPDRILLSDATNALCALIQSGRAAATICQQPYQQGYQAMKALLNLVLIGQKPESDTFFTQSEIKLRYNL